MKSIYIYHSVHLGAVMLGVLSVIFTEFSVRG